MSALGDALRELVADGVARMRPENPAGSAGPLPGAVGDGAGAERARAELLGVARRIGAAVDEAMERDRSSLRELVTTVGWLLELPPAEQPSLADEEPPEQRVAEILGLLGSARIEAALIEGSPPPAADGGEVARVCHVARRARSLRTIERWIAEKLP